MKVFVVFTLLIAATSAARNLCKKKGADLAQSEVMKDTIVVGANRIFGHCLSLDINELLFGEETACLPLFNQAFCYGQLAYKQYSNITTWSYGDLARGIPDIQDLGKHSCSNFRVCYDSLKLALNECMKQDGFVDEAVVAMEAMYRDYGEEIVKRLGDNANVLVSELVTLVRERFDSIDEIEDAVDEYLSDDIVSDFEIALEKFDDAAVKWCDDKCTGKTGRFVKALFMYMDEGEQCNNASVYCGECKTRADEHLAMTPIPCCLDEVIEDSVSGVTYVQESYKELIGDFQSYLEESLSADAIKKGMEIRDRILKQLECIDDSYKRTTNTCGPVV